MNYKKAISRNWTRIRILVHLYRLKLITSYSVFNSIQEDSCFAVIFAKYKTCGNTGSAVVNYNE